MNDFNLDPNIIYVLAVLIGTQVFGISVLTAFSVGLLISGATLLVKGHRSEAQWELGASAALIATSQLYQYWGERTSRATQLIHGLAVFISMSAWLLWLFYCHRRNTIARWYNLSAEEAQKAFPPNQMVKVIADNFYWLLALFLIRGSVIDWTLVPTPSMEPTIRVGDWVIVNRMSYGIKDPLMGYTIGGVKEPKRGDIAVFIPPTNPTELFVKRVIGLPGDIIVYRSGRFTVTPYSGAKREVKEAMLVAEYSSLVPPVITNLGEPIEFTETLGDINYKVQLTPNRIEELDARVTQRDYPPGIFQVPEDQYFVIGDNRDNSFDSRFWGTVPKENLVGKAKFVLFHWDPDANGLWNKVKSFRFGHSLT